MGSTYREITPSPNLAPFVECFWAGDIFKDCSARILPDGCADILFITRKNELIETQVVGVMTRPHVVPLAAGTVRLGLIPILCHGDTRPTHHDDARGTAAHIG